MGNVCRLGLLALMCGGLVPVGLAAQAAAAGPPGNNAAGSADGRLPAIGTNAGPIVLAGATLAAIGAGAVLLGP